MLQHLLLSVMPGKLPVHRKCCEMFPCKSDGDGGSGGGGRWRKERREMVSRVIVLVCIPP